MNIAEVRRDYQAFFKTEGGKHFEAEIARQIEDHHTKAENEPELAAAHTQRAKGVRGIDSHIRSLLAERKVPMPK